MTLYSSLHALCLCLNDLAICQWFPQRLWLIWFEFLLTLDFILLGTKSFSDVTLSLVERFVSGLKQFPEFNHLKWKRTENFDSSQCKPGTPHRMIPKSLRLISHIHLVKNIYKVSEKGRAFQKTLEGYWTNPLSVTSSRSIRFVTASLARCNNRWVPPPHAKPFCATGLPKPFGSKQKKHLVHLMGKCHQIFIKMALLQYSCCSLKFFGSSEACSHVLYSFVILFWPFSGPFAAAASCFHHN